MDKEIKEDGEGGVAPAATNAMGASSPSNPNSPIAQPERFLKGKKLRNIVARKSLGELRDGTK